MRAEHHLVHDLALVAHGKADRFASLHFDIARHGVRCAARADIGLARVLMRRGHEPHLVVIATRTVRMAFFGSPARPNGISSAFE